MNLPTHFQLASLAASYTGGGNAAERVEAVLAIWHEAAATLDPKSEPSIQTSSFQDFLIRLMPKVESPSTRMKRFRDFLTWRERGGYEPRTTTSVHQLNGFGGTEWAEVELTDEMVEEAVDEQMRKYREDGIQPEPETVEKFHAWDFARTAEIRGKRARKAAEARHSK